MGGKQPQLGQVDNFYSTVSCQKYFMESPTAGAHTNIIGFFCVLAKWWNRSPTPQKTSWQPVIQSLLDVLLAEKQNFCSKLNMFWVPTRTIEQWFSELWLGDSKLELGRTLATLTDCWWPQRPRDPWRNCQMTPHLRIPAVELDDIIFSPGVGLQLMSWRQRRGLFKL